MKKKLILLTVILAIGMMSVSCFKKKDKKADKKQTQQQVENKDINTDIFNLGAQQANGGNPDIKNLTPEEQQKLIDNQIDPVKVSEAITKAEAGDKEAIMSLSQLYFNLKDNEKVKKFLQMGVDRNYPEAIYNLAVILKQEGNTAEANKLMARLPKNVTTVARGGRQQVQVRQLRMRPGAEEFNRGVELVRAKKYSQAKAEFEKAYNKGIKDADVRIAMLNKEMKNYPEAIKWLKKASNRGVKGTDVEIGAILYDNGKQEESRPYLMKSYNSGNKGLAGAIAATYHKEKNMSEALKWYKIAAKNGDKNAKEIVSQLESGGKVAETTKRGVKSFLNGGEAQNESLTKQTLKQVNNSNESKDANKNELKIKEVEAPKHSVTVKEEKSSTPEQPKHETKKEVNVDELLKSKAAEYNK